MAIEYVIDLINEEQTDIFIKEWNKRFGEEFGLVRKKINNHDFGPYPSVVMNEKTFYDGIDKGIEDKVTELADELNLEY